MSYRSFASLVICLSILMCSGVMATNLTVANGKDSTVNASSEEDGPQSTGITGQGVFTATSGGGDPDTSSATATISDTGNLLSLSQTLSDAAVSPVVQPANIPTFTESGSEDLFFTVATATAFNLSGSYTTTIILNTVASPDVLIEGSTSINASLYDVTTSTSVFNESDTEALGTTASLSTETGTLKAGDLYEFQAGASMSAANGDAVDPGGSGNVNLAMTPGTLPIGGSVPLPAALWTGAIAVLAAGIARKKLLLAA